MITLKFSKFEFKTMYKELVVFACVLTYALFEIYVLKIESDPMYFMPENDIMEILGVSYPVFLVLYILVFALYFASFYVISELHRKKKNKDDNFKQILGIIKEDI